MTSSEQSQGYEAVDYDEFEGILADADFESSTAELQAFFGGLLAAGHRPTDGSWRALVVDVLNDGKQLDSATEDAMGSLFHWTANQLNQQESLAPVLLPDDSYPAIDQLEALVDWSEGFLLGFGLQTGNQPVENEEVNESLRDLAEICQLELEVEESEETQIALTTLVEHLRVAVQVIHWELVVSKLPQTTGYPESDGQPTLH